MIAPATYIRALPTSAASAGYEPNEPGPEYVYLTFTDDEDGEDDMVAVPFAAPPRVGEEVSIHTGGRARAGTFEVVKVTHTVFPHSADAPYTVVFLTPIPGSADPPGSS